MVRSLLVSSCALALLATGPASLVYPVAPSDGTVDIYVGTRVSDPYRPLENANDPAVKAWAAAETKLATDYLASQPSYPFYAKRLGRRSRRRLARRSNPTGRRRVYVLR